MAAIAFEVGPAMIHRFAASNAAVVTTAATSR